MALLHESSDRHERRIQQLLVYSITDESERLDLQHEINRLKQLVER